MLVATILGGLEILNLEFPGLNISHQQVISFLTPRSSVPQGRHRCIQRTVRTAHHQ